MTVAPNVVVSKVMKFLNPQAHPPGHQCPACLYDGCGKAVEQASASQETAPSREFDEFDFDMDEAEAHEMYRWASEQIERNWLTENELVTLVNGRISPDMTSNEVEKIWKEVLRTYAHE